MMTIPFQTEMGSFCPPAIYWVKYSKIDKETNWVTMMLHSLFLIASNVSKQIIVGLGFASVFLFA